DATATALALSPDQPGVRTGGRIRSRSCSRRSSDPPARWFVYRAEQFVQASARAPSSSADDRQVAGVDVLGLAALICDGIDRRRSRACAAEIVGAAFVVGADLSAEVDGLPFLDLAGLMQERCFHRWSSSCPMRWRASPLVWLAMAIS